MKDIVHAREWINNDIFSVEVTVVVELNGHEHLSRMKNALNEAGYRYVIISQPTVRQRNQQHHQQSGCGSLAE